MIQKITDIEKYIDEMGSDAHELFGGKFTGNYHVQLVPSDIKEYIEILYKFNIKNAIEIGVAAGGSSRILTDIHKGINNYILIDNEAHPKRPFYYNTNRTFIKTSVENLYEFNGDSHSNDCVLFLANTILDYDIDFIFLDGDNTENGRKKDFDMLYPYLKTGCLCVIDNSKNVPHNYCRHFINEYKEKFDILFDSDSSSGMFIGVLK